MQTGAILHIVNGHTVMEKGFVAQSQEYLQAQILAWLTAEPCWTGEYRILIDNPSFDRQAQRAS